ERADDLGVAPRLGAESVLEVAAGQLLRVTLHVAVPETTAHVVLDDPLPGGLEPVNFSLKTSGSDGKPIPSVFTHEELHDDRVSAYAAELAPGLYRHSYVARARTPGRFLAPAARAEAMYAPERAGSTAAETFVVRAPAAGVAAP